ncbi:MAG: CHASE domain-containing protein, partial [Syntrophales bacterium]|nr:CHASE domain-containing protein [Syntrophales bacterium]
MLSFKNRQDIFRISTWVIILGGLLMSTIAFAIVHNWERQRLRVNFERAAEDRYAALKREVESNIEVLSSIKAFYLHAKVVTRAEFHNFTESFLLQHPGIQALEWIPRVPYSQRVEYEKAAKRDGFKDFQITEQLAQKKIVTAGKRSEYFPVYFVEPYKSNELVLGYDLTSNPLHKEALDRSRDTGGIAAIARITLVQEKKGQSGFLVFAPVYQKDMPAASTQARKDNIRGFAVGVFRVGDVVEKSLTYLNPEGIDYYLYDSSAQGKERFLYFHPARTGQTKNLLRNEGSVPDGSLKITRTLKVADREWQILFVATPDYIARGKTWQPWGILLAGLLLTGLLAGFLIVEARRAEELTNSNELLSQEIAGHRKTEEELRLSEERFRHIFEEGPVGMVLVSPDYTIVTVNEVFCKLLGYTEQELTGQSVADITCEEDREKSREFAAQLFSGSIPMFCLEKRYVRKDGTILWANLTASAIHGKEGNVLYNLVIIEDLTEGRKTAEEIRMLNYYDSLTGLPNRTFHKELIKRSID